ncbi:hypothetical protein PRIPAC_79820 [Pristionchus pacificus]|uniref:Uncharacterized protein n=1 Tax=Pristionchus pacificus TaxID=54126 RepID=A0A2A6BW05_PRIPA|nr:hypothetical protein PRIPAC_79820 [Pristionchus pacificus]|eukprot:PDM70047.1 hypothetical protein PRIPAC_49259 [Pristionchus pacificus]
MAASPPTSCSDDMMTQPTGSPTLRAHVIGAGDAATLAARASGDLSSPDVLTSSANLANELTLRFGQRVRLEQLLQYKENEPATARGDSRVEAARVRVKRYRTGLQLIDN